MIRLLTPATGVVFYSSGILMESVKKNWFNGIRTPWTLSSDVVWDKTHKLDGRVFKIVGIVTLLGILVENIAILVILARVLVVAVFLIIYLYLPYKEDRKLNEIVIDSNKTADNILV
jgi:uncharacterized membrane protein